jgi:hypothetical protein
MSREKRRRLESTVAAIQTRHGMQALYRGSAPVRVGEARRLPPYIPTGFAALDALTGCRGIPLGAITLLSGKSTSGKLTLAYKLLANAQRTAAGAAAYHTVALVDLNHSADPDYLARCGIDLSLLLVVRPPVAEKTIHLLLDLARSRQVRLIVVDSLADLAPERAVAQALDDALRRFAPLLRAAGCGLVLIDEPSPPWLRWLRRDGRWQARQQAALHLEMQRERWLTYADHASADTLHRGPLVGYRAQARLVRSRWAPAGSTVPVEIVFNGTVKARETW